MSTEPASVEPFSNVVLLVCRDCRERSSGPKKLKAQDIAKALRQTVRLERPRPRVLQSSCLGLCPKRATAVACAGGNVGRITGVRKLGEVEQLVPALSANPAQPV